MPLSESEIKLRGLLKEIRDEKNFVNGMLSGLRQCDKTDKIIKLWAKIHFILNINIDLGEMLLLSIEEMKK